MKKIAGTFVKAHDDEVKEPERSTDGSAGYDFFLPESMIIHPGETVRFNTGIIANIDPGWVLLLMPRSSLGMKGLMVTNTVGVIDSDFRKEITGCLTNTGAENLFLAKGDRYMQGIFVEYGITVDDAVSKKRNGGIGSTGR